MNIVKKYELYKKFLSMEPIDAVRMDRPEWNFYRIKMGYEIDGIKLTLNAYIDKDWIFGYGANVMNGKEKTITTFFNPFFAKKLYEHGQRFL